MRYRSYFWPAVLILAGGLALLVNTGALTADRLSLLVNLWPLILIVWGIELVVRRSAQGTARDAATAAIVVLAIIAAIAYVAVAPNPAAAHTLDASSDVGSVTDAAAEIDAGAANITITGSGNLGSRLYHAHLEYSGPAPQVRLDNGTLTISQESSFWDFGRQAFTLKLDVNQGVAWKIEVNTGSSNDTINVPRVHVTGLTLNTGASREEITLGAPSGVVPIEINGGALTSHFHRPSGTPASVSVSGGAVNLTADGKSFHAIGGANYESSNFAGATDAYRIQVNGGACTVTLDTTPGLD